MKNVSRKKAAIKVACKTCGHIITINQKNIGDIRGVSNLRTFKLEFWIWCPACDNTFVRVSRRKIPKSRLNRLLAMGRFESSSTLAY